MSTNHRITDVARSAIGELTHIGKFTESVHSAILGKLHTLSKPKDLSREEIEQLALLGKAMLTEPTVKHRRVKKPIEVFNMEVSDRVASHTLGLVTSIKQQSFISEMSLVYTISRLEAFLKDFLKAILIERPEMLKSSNQISWADALSHSSMKSLRETLATCEADALGRGSIDEAAKHFQSKTNLNMASFEQWNELREHIYRRNLIVHNKSIVNETYVKKTKCQNKLGDHLSTDAQYIESAVETTIEFINFMHATALKKFAKKT